MTAYQLTLDGGEVPYERVSEERRLAGAGLEVLRVLGSDGWISPKLAGRIAHGDRSEGRERHESSDGCTLLRRMARRGLVRHKRRGVWVAAEPLGRGEA